jgi:ribosomal protein L40E
MPVPTSVRRPCRRCGSASPMAAICRYKCSAS